MKILLSSEWAGPKCQGIQLQVKLQGICFKTFLFSDGANPIPPFTQQAIVVPGCPSRSPFLWDQEVKNKDFHTVKKKNEVALNGCKIITTVLSTTFPSSFAVSLNCHFDTHQSDRNCDLHFFLAQPAKTAALPSVLMTWEGTSFGTDVHQQKVLLALLEMAIIVLSY